MSINLMHPFWIKKIEEQRRDRNTLFWVVFFVAVIFPVCLVGKLDVCLLFSLSCFCAAITRLYYWYREIEKEKEQALLTKHQEKSLNDSSELQEEEVAA